MRNKENWEKHKESLKDPLNSGAFTDHYGNHVQSGDTVVYELTGEVGTVRDILPDGDARLYLKSGVSSPVKWNHLHLAGLTEALKEVDRVEVVSEALRDPLLAEREKTHGSFKKNAQAFNKFRSIMVEFTGGELSDVQILSLTMISVKMARICTGNPNEPDHWADIAGYAKLVVEDLEKNNDRT